MWLQLDINIVIEGLIILQNMRLLNWTRNFLNVSIFKMRRKVIQGIHIRGVPKNEIYFWNSIPFNFFYKITLSRSITVNAFVPPLRALFQSFFVVAFTKNWQLLPRFFSLALLCLRSLERRVRWVKKRNHRIYSNIFLEKKWRSVHKSGLLSGKQLWMNYVLLFDVWFDVTPKCAPCPSAAARRSSKQILFLIHVLYTIYIYIYIYLFLATRYLKYNWIIMTFQSVFRPLPR